MTETEKEMTPEERLNYLRERVSVFHKRMNRS